MTNEQGAQDITGPVLLTVDEARSLLASSGLHLVHAADFAGSDLDAALSGQLAPTVGSDVWLTVVALHRTVIRFVRLSGNSWILEDELEGLRSYAKRVLPQASSVAA